MKKSVSLEKIYDAEIVSRVKNSSYIRRFPDVIIAPKRRLRNTLENYSEIYSIIIRPKLHRSCSFSELTTNCSDSSFVKQTNSISVQKYSSKSFYEQSGDALVKYCSNSPSSTAHTHMSWNYKGKSQKKKSAMTEDTYGSKFAKEFAQSNQIELAPESSHPEDSSAESSDHDAYRRPMFPFKSTPSGNLKVQSNQVVFQSSTVGVLLADPTQAKVKVKFEGKAAGEPDDDSEINDPPGTCHSECGGKPKLSEVNHENGKNLESLGFTQFEPVDWLRVQLPKKQDLFQEFYRRVHNYVNTDAIIHIGDEEFHCHHIVLQVYSAFFNANTQKDITLPAARVTPQAFQTLYEWMIFSGPESNRVLKRENILALYCAAQFLAIKDLEDQCWAFIANESLINEDTAFALFREARAKGIKEVMDLMVPRVQRFFLPLVASRDFFALELDEILIFLRSNYICVTSEIEVLMAGVRWLHGDWPERRRHAADVMRCVRFGLISPWQLVDIKRNPDNAEILEIVNDPDVQQMVDDGLAYVIIKYWYGNNSKNYYHWIDVLGLTEPAERNWIGEETNHVTFKDFLKYLEQFMAPKDQVYQQMALMQPPRRNDDMPGSLRGMDADKMDSRRPKLDLPLPTTLKGFTGDKEKFPMSEFFMDQRKNKDRSPPGESPSTAPRDEDLAMQMKRMRNVLHGRSEQAGEDRKRTVQSKFHLPAHRPQLQQIQMCLLEQDNQSQKQREQAFELPEKDSIEELNTNQSETSDSEHILLRYERRPSAAAAYLAAATAAMAGTKAQTEAASSSAQRASATPNAPAPGRQNNTSPTISLFNQSKESLARKNMNKLSTSILGPTNKIYTADGSLFNYTRETVLVFGGIDPHANYGLGRNTGKDIFRFDPVTNTWDIVGELPEPRHHHSVAFLRGRVYLVGGSDPRDDDTRGKSVVVSTVWSFEPVTRAWFSESGLAVPRKNFGLVVHKMALYAIGGQDKKGRVLRSVEKFDPATGFWSEVRSMSVARMAAAAAKYREYIWVAGGMTGDKKRPVCKVVECYNSETNQWTAIYDLRFPRCFSTLFAMNDKLYLVGGAGKVSEREKTASSVGAIDYWDWKSRSWKQQTEMSIPRHGHALAYLGTQMIIIGGVTTIYMRALNNVESFCCEREAWIRGVASMPSPLSGHGAVTLPPASLM
ncbi:uncharacterized protein LOC133521482 isoform X1 [Cydia pomonella]|uniref:uncharacterized protein LOC133521482 isoform X1 n=1 Tax=Cydia pomonella TaxID=82600 RepID=UPI002ADE2A6A|nr:uncharacterized protein LOC133521482 isoform X1 [Cydia pomonella]